METICRRSMIRSGLGLPIAQPRQSTTARVARRHLGPGRYVAGPCAASAACWRWTAAPLPPRTRSRPWARARAPRARRRGELHDGPVALAIRRLADRRPRRRPPAGRVRGRRGPGRLNGEIYNFAALRARPGAPRPPLRGRAATRGARPPLRGARPPVPAPRCAACSRWRSGTRASGGCCSRATLRHQAAASTRSATGGWRSPRSSRRCCACRGVSRELDLDALETYLALQLRPGAAHDLPRRSASCRPATSWSPAPGARARRALGAPEPVPAGAVRASRPRASWPPRRASACADSVRAHLEADVAGRRAALGRRGLGTVAALAARELGGRLKTFSVGFDGAARSTSWPMRRLVARRYGTDAPRAASSAPRTRR